MKYSGRTLMSFGAVVVGGWAVATAMQWPLKTSLFPLVVGIPVFFMALAEFVLSLSAERKKAQQEMAREVKLLDDADDAGDVLPVGKVLLAFLLIIGFLFLLLLVGFTLGIPLFVLLYIKFYGRERWKPSLALAVLAGAGFYGLFVRTLHIPFPRGLALEFLRYLGID